MALRIASLLPSASEIVAALGAEDALVARSHECDYPEGIEALPALTEARMDSTGTSAEIHARVESALKDVLSVYRVDAEGLRALAPDVIVTQAQCEVCAVSEDEVRAAIAPWAQNGEGGATKLVSLTAEDLAGVYADIAAVAAALGREEDGRRLIARMRERLDAIGCRAVEGGWKPRLLLVEWMDPPMAGGNWMPELIGIAGGEAVLAEAGKHSPWIEPPDIVAADPDAILIAPCGFAIRRALADLPALEALPGWSGLKAVRKGAVAIADGSAFFNRPGPRLVETTEIIAEFLHPDVFDFGHEGRSWRLVTPVA